MALIKNLKFSIKMQKGLCHEIIYNLQWWIKNFSEGEANYQSHIILQIFCQKLHENKRIWTSSWHVPGTAPLGSANDLEC